MPDSNSGFSCGNHQPKIFSEIPIPRPTRQQLGDQTWTPITTDEFSAYLGFIILLGLPCISDYWKEDERFHYLPVADAIPQDPFLEVHWSSHFRNYSCLPRPDYTPGSSKLGPILTDLSKCCAAFYTVGQDFNIEAMVLFKERSSFSSTCLKLVEGFKVWVCTKTGNGYVLAFEVYTSKKDSVEKGQRQMSVSVMQAGVTCTSVLLTTQLESGKWRKRTMTWSLNSWPTL